MNGGDEITHEGRNVKQTYHGEGVKERGKHRVKNTYSCKVVGCKQSNDEGEKGNHYGGRHT